eukprot:TRINITY_DN33844_c0_g1_i1.p2 TRINITY_DN33844_c0_g1~~TRINITY_DN33844_c0_g1_i1.p2  ORF type:complete len:102 (+),score=18.26 TRINITY_DN33844_c0_g1_i1:4-309(+)
MSFVVSVRFFFFQAEDGIRDFCLSRGLGDVYKRQGKIYLNYFISQIGKIPKFVTITIKTHFNLNPLLILSLYLSLAFQNEFITCLLYTSDAADEEDSIDFC